MGLAHSKWYLRVIHGLWILCWLPHQPREVICLKLPPVNFFFCSDFAFGKICVVARISFWAPCRSDFAGMRIAGQWGLACGALCAPHQNVAEPVQYSTRNVAEPVKCSIRNVAEPVKCSTRNVAEPVQCSTRNVAEPVQWNTSKVAESVQWNTSKIAESVQCSTSNVTPEM